MVWLKALISFCILVVLLATGAVITFNNAQPVALDLLFWQSPQLALGILTLVVLLVGLALGFVLNTLWSWRLIQQKAKLQKQLDQALKRFEQLQ